MKAGDLTVDAAVDIAFAIGMHQHDGEVRPFAHAIAEDLRPRHVMEIGALHGGTAFLLAALSTGRVISADLPNGKFGGADHNYGSEKCAARNRGLFEKIGRRFQGILGDSHDERVLDGAKYVLKGEKLDLLLIDGDHSLEGVVKDWTMYSGLVRHGGWVAFHDVDDTDFHREAKCEVPLLWRQLAAEHDTRWFSIGGAWGGIGVVVI